MSAEEAIKKLGRFTLSELAKLMGCSRATADRRLKKLIEAQVVRKTDEMRKHGPNGPGTGPGRPAPVYEAQSKISRRTLRAMKAESTPQVNREKIAPPEKQVKGTKVKRSTPVAGSGKSKTKGTHSEIRRLLDAAVAQKLTVEPTGSGHYKVHGPERMVVLPATPSDHRAIKNARAELRRAGVEV